MSRERLLSTLKESMGLNRIAKIHNISQNKLKKIRKMSNYLQNIKSQELDTLKTTKICQRKNC